MKSVKFSAISALLVALLSNPAGFFDLSAQKKLQEQQRKEYKEQMRKNALYDKQMRCLREALWHEARGEPEQGVRAVATVILNRTKSTEYPSSICAVINQRKQFSYVHQFKAKGKKTTLRVTESEKDALKVVDTIVQEVYTLDFVAVLAPEVLWYHTTKVKPKWSAKKKQVAIIGNHVFKQE